MCLPKWLGKLFPKERVVRKDVQGRKLRARKGRFLLTVTSLEERMSPAVLTVNSLFDGPVSGTTATMTLREAIMLVDTGGAATDAAGTSLSAAKAGQIDSTNPFSVDDTIRFDPSLVGQTPIILNQGELLLTANVTILGVQGNPIAVSGNGSSRVLEIASGAVVTISGLTLEDGNSAMGAGIANAGSLTLIDSSIVNNVAGTGAGIANTGTLTLTDSAVSNNSAQLNSGGMVNLPGGNLTVVDSLISGNSAGVGNGGVANYGASLTLVDSTVTGNSAVGAGGIGNYAGTMTLTDATVSGNTGGGVLNTAWMTITDSTIVDNAAGSGAGLANEGNLTMTGSTVLDNSALLNNGGVLNLPGGNLAAVDSLISGNSAGIGNGGVANYGASLTLVDSTVSGNTALGGGGIGNYAGTMALVGTTVSGNTGGGILNTAALTLTDSSVTGNTAVEGNGGLANYGGSATLINTAIWGNSGSPTTGSNGTFPVVAADSGMAGLPPSDAPSSSDSNTVATPLISATPAVTVAPVTNDNAPVPLAITLVGPFASPASEIADLPTAGAGISDVYQAGLSSGFSGHEFLHAINGKATQDPSGPVQVHVVAANNVSADAAACAPATLNSDNSFGDLAHQSSPLTELQNIANAIGETATGTAFQRVDDSPSLHPSSATNLAPIPLWTGHGRTKAAAGTSIAGNGALWLESMVSGGDNGDIETAGDGPAGDDLGHSISEWIFGGDRTILAASLVLAVVLHERRGEEKWRRERKHDRAGDNRPA